MCRRVAFVSGMTCALVWALLPGSVQVAASALETKSAEQPEKAPLVGEAAEEFLRTAKFLKSRSIPVGVTHPLKVTLTDGHRTESGIWKTVDIFRQIQRFAEGGMELGFRDSYKNEIAAYELDKILGLGMVPPTVERRWRNKRGSLQLWLEDTITEAERLKSGRRPPDSDGWNNQMYTVRLIHQLCDDSDFNNVANLLVDGDFKIWIIDHSRAFRLHDELMAEGDLKRFSRSMLEKLRQLDFDLLKKRLGRWLTKRQIEAFLSRRDLILDRAERLVAESGEEAVLYP